MAGSRAAAEHQEQLAKKTTGAGAAGFVGQTPSEEKKSKTFPYSGAGDAERKRETEKQERGE